MWGSDQALAPSWAEGSEHDQTMTRQQLDLKILLFILSIARSCPVQPVHHLFKLRRHTHVPTNLWTTGCNWLNTYYAHNWIGIATAGDAASERVDEPHIGLTDCIAGPDRSRGLTPNAKFRTIPSRTLGLSDTIRRCSNKPVVVHSPQFTSWLTRLTRPNRIKEASRTRFIPRDNTTYPPSSDVQCYPHWREWRERRE